MQGFSYLVKNGPPWPFCGKKMLFCGEKFADWPQQLSHVLGQKKQLRNMNWPPFYIVHSNRMHEETSTEHDREWQHGKVYDRTACQWQHDSMAQCMTWHAPRVHTWARLVCWCCSDSWPRLPGCWPPPLHLCHGSVVLTPPTWYWVVLTVVLTPPTSTTLTIFLFNWHTIPSTK